MEHISTCSLERTPRWSRGMYPKEAVTLWEVRAGAGSWQDLWICGERSPRGHKSCQKTCSSVDSSLHRSTGPARNLLQRGLPTGSQPPLGIHLLWRGVLHGLQVDICSTVDLPGLQGDSLPYHGLLGNLCPSTWSTFSPPSSLTLGSAGLFLLHVLTPLSGCSFCAPATFFSPFLNLLSQRHYHCH